MIISKYRNGNTIYTSWRNEKGEKQEEKNLTFTPYFYVLDSSEEPKTYKVGALERFFTYEKTDAKTLDGRPLKKVIVERQSDISSAVKRFNQTWEADVPLHFRYCVDELKTLPEFKLRKWYWDMEWMPSGEYKDAITAISVYDNYDEKFYLLYWNPNEHPRMETPKIEGFETEFMKFSSEKLMLLAFLLLLRTRDPDMLIAWFGLKFDLPVLISRLEANSIDPLDLSPIREVKGVSSRGWERKDGYSRYESQGYSPIAQPIAGRITLNLDLAFERQWNDSQRGTLPSLSLDYVSNLLFGEGKSWESKFEGDDFYNRGWLEDTYHYLQYALVDVDILRKIDETNFTSEAIVSLQRLLVAPFDACFYASHMGSIYFMRNASWKAPTGSKVDEREDYQGAMIYDPTSEGTNGLHLNVAAFDFAGLYPSMMIARNISWETKSEEPTEFGVNILTPRDFSEENVKEMRYYKTDRLGLLPRSVLHLKNLRNDYKKKMRKAREADNESEYNKWYNNQMAVKRLMASFYGIVAYQGFGWADVELAASITASAREAIREAAFAAKEMN
jgi:DNA polymerase elongation subunit (family B)